jgi:hypothetical protein
MFDQMEAYAPKAFDANQLLGIEAFSEEGKEAAMRLPPFAMGG